MKRTRSLEDFIVAIYQIYGDQKLRWSQIRNELLAIEDIPEDVRFSEGFSVKLSRALNRLCKEGVLQRHEEGHRKVRYSLAENASEKLQGTISFVIRGVGQYKPGDTWKDVKKRIIQQMIEDFEENDEPFLKKQFEQAESHFKKIR
ncbi:MAG: hypothetical protein ACFFCD_16610 [Promethearchaeota archaeon]